MKLAIPAWNEQVSTTFDFARNLLVVEVDGKREISREEATLGDEPIGRKARRIQNLGVQIVLCGAVSQPFARAVSQAGIQIIPYVAGQVDDVLGAYFCDRLSEPRFIQPGCRPGARRRWRNQGAGCHGQRGCQ